MAKEPVKSPTRAARLARALKVNLMRRKAQKRARKDELGKKAPEPAPKAE